MQLLGSFIERECLDLLFFLSSINPDGRVLASRLCRKGSVDSSRLRASTPFESQERQTLCSSLSASAVPPVKVLDSIARKAAL